MSTNPRGRLKKLAGCLLLAVFLVLSQGVELVYAQRVPWWELPWDQPCIPEDKPPELTDLICVLVRIIGALFYVVGALAAIYLIIGAIRFVTAGGDEKALAQAKKAITYAILGMIIAWGAVFIIDLVGKQIGYDLTKITIP